MSAPNLLDDTDLPWVTAVLDTVEAAAGQPWRVALERLDDTRRVGQPRAPVRFAAVVGAIQRLLGGRVRNARQARSTRARVLGVPALTPHEREARIADAARELEITSAAVESLLWSDLPRERPVELPAGRPSELEVAATANVHLLQRTLMRAQSVELRVWGDAALLIHAAAARGLLSTVWRGGRGETVLDVLGPLALFHRTGVYGRALAGLAPLLGECERFELAIVARSRDDTYAVEVASPVLLPAAPARLLAPGRDVRRLAKELGRLAPEAMITPRPWPLAAGASLVCPDLVIEHASRRTYVELVGFWTTEFLERKHALYRAAGIEEIVFCVDQTRGCTTDELPAGLPIVPATQRTGALARELLVVATGRDRCRSPGETVPPASRAP